MHKNKIKLELENFVHDYQYYLEKTKEIDALKDQTNRSIERLNSLKEKELPTLGLEKSVSKIMQKQANEEKILIDILKRKQKIEHTIQNINQPKRNVLYLKYLRFNTFDQIAGKMNYSTKRIYQLHSEGVKEYIKAYGSFSLEEENKVEADKSNSNEINRR